MQRPMKRLILGALVAAFLVAIPVSHLVMAAEGPQSEKARQISSLVDRAAALIKQKGIIYLTLKICPHQSGLDKKQNRRKKAPGKSHRQGISMLELIPDETSAESWFEETYWPNGRCCGRCGSLNTRQSKTVGLCPAEVLFRQDRHGPGNGSPFASAFAVYIYVTCLKSVSSMKLSRDLKVTQKTAWFMLHRLREAWDGTALSL